MMISKLFIIRWSIFIFLANNAYCDETYDDQTDHTADDFQLIDNWDTVKFNRYIQEPGPGKETRYTYSSICKDEKGQMRILPGFDCRRQVAVGRFQNAINITGWSFLEIETMPEYPPEEQAYAAGVLEGFLSKQLIGYHLENTVLHTCENYTIYCNKLHKFMRQNMEWIKNTLFTKTADDIYWAQINRTLYQLTGLYHGYDGTPISPTISYEIHPILKANSMGEFFDLEKKFNKTLDPGTVEGRCSGLVKITPDNADLLFSHVTMNGFQYMTRILKLYKFGYNATAVPGHTYSFSSYPGVIYSSDDFVLTSAGLAALETTINVLNQSLFDEIEPTMQIPMWIRVKNANELARNCRQWCRIFSHYNSGTYNNQWVVVDYKRFKPRRPVPNNGLMYVLEQLPGFITYHDLTGLLKKKTYFASYNLPWFNSVNKKSGMIKQANKYGDWYRWGKSPRARIFERDHHKVIDIDTLTELMRYNDYKHDEFSRCNCTPPYTAEAAISARGDLNLPDGKYEFKGMGHLNHGALDYKGTNYKMFKQLRFRAISSPPYKNVPAFQWSKFDFDKRVRHIGHPDCWKFAAVEPVWETFDVTVDF